VDEGGEVEKERERAGMHKVFGGNRYHY